MGGGRRSGGQCSTYKPTYPPLLPKLPDEEALSPAGQALTGPDSTQHRRPIAQALEISPAVGRGDREGRPGCKRGELGRCIRRATDAGAGPKSRVSGPPDSFWSSNSCECIVRGSSAMACF